MLAENKEFFDIEVVVKHFDCFAKTLQSVMSLSFMEHIYSIFPSSFRPYATWKALQKDDGSHRPSFSGTVGSTEVMRAEELGTS